MSKYYCRECKEAIKDGCTDYCSNECLDIAEDRKNARPEMVLKSDHDSALAAKDAEIAELKEKLILTGVGVGHFKSERDIHIKESERFVNESIAQLKAKDETIKRLTECVSFYADKANWTGTHFHDDRLSIANDSEWLSYHPKHDAEYGGKLAREALAALGGK